MCAGTAGVAMAWAGVGRRGPLGHKIHFVGGLACCRECGESSGVQVAARQGVAQGAKAPSRPNCHKGR